MRRFTIWSGVHSIVPQRWASPGGEDEVAALLYEADRAGRRVRPVGSGHSWSPVALAEDVLVDLSRMSRVLGIDAAARTITVQAGCLLETINAALDAVGLAMPILGSVAKQTIAGAISTGTHGSSLRWGNLATLVTRLRLVTPTGDILELDERDERLAGARVSLGALGIVTELTLRVVPAFRLAEERETRSIAEIAATLAEIAESAEFAKVWWLPGSELATVFRYHRTVEPVTERDVWRAIDQYLVNDLVFDAALKLSRTRPAMTELVNRTVASSYLGSARRVARSDRAFNLAMPPVHRETEHAVDLEDAGALVSETLAMVARQGIRVNFPYEIRFVGADDGWLSPAYGRDTCQVGAYMAESADLERYFAGFDAIGRALGGRPHWGKELRADHAYLRSVYPEFDRFVALRDELDPHGTMSNAFLDRVLGPARSAQAMPHAERW